MEQNWSISHEWTCDEVVRARERGLKEYEICSVSWALSAASRWDEAELVAQALSDPEERNQALGILAQYLVRAGEVSRAQLIADEVSQRDHTERIVALIAIARAHLDAGDNETARAVTSEAEHNARQSNDSGWVRTEYMADVGYLWLRLNDRSRALQIWSDAAEIAIEEVRKYPSDIDTQKTLAYIGRGFVDAGDDERALELTTVLYPRYAGWIHDHIREKRN